MSISKEDLNVLICHHCKKLFEDGEVGFTISRSYFNQDSMDFFVTMFQDKSAKVSVERLIRFHENCFQEVAGSEYMP